MPRSRRRATARAFVAAALLACAPAGAAHGQAAPRACVYDPTANGFLPAVETVPGSSSGAAAVPAGVAALASTAASALLPVARPPAPRHVEGTPWDTAPRLAPDGLAPGLTAFLSGPC